MAITVDNERQSSISQIMFSFLFECDGSPPLMLCFWVSYTHQSSRLIRRFTHSLMFSSISSQPWPAQPTPHAA